MTEQQFPRRNMPVQITDENFDFIVSQNSMVIVDFWAPWCGPCKQIAPFVDELAIELSNQALIGKLNVDEDPNVPLRFHVRSIPTIMLFKAGRPIDQIVGALGKNTLVKRIMSNLQ